jgi:hypothetical protein
MKHFLTLWLLCAGLCIQAQHFSYGDNHGGFIEKSGNDYYFREFRNGRFMPTRIVVFKKMDSTGLADTLGLRKWNERSVGIKGKIKDSIKIYRRGLPFSIIEAEYISGSMISHNWYVDTEIAEPQQDTIFEVFYNNSFRGQFSEIVNGKVSNINGVPLNKTDSIIADYLRNNKISFNLKKGMYFKVQAKRWYGSTGVFGHDAGFHYIMEVTKVIEADSTRTLWGYYANEIEHGRTINFPYTDVSNPPNDFDKGKTYKYSGETYNYDGKGKGYKVTLEIEKKSGCNLLYKLSYSKNGKPPTVISGVMDLHIFSYVETVNPGPYPLEYLYENEVWQKSYFSIGIDTAMKDRTKKIYLTDLEDYENPGISCELKRLN